MLFCFISSWVPRHSQYFFTCSDDYCCEVPYAFKWRLRSHMRACHVTLELWVMNRADLLCFVFIVFVDEAAVFTTYL